MNKLNAILFALLFTLGQTANAAAEWIPFAFGDHVSVSADKHSQSKSAETVKAWVKFQYDIPQAGNSESGYASYSQTIILYYANCKESKLAASTETFYDISGKVVHGRGAVDVLSFQEPVPDSLGSVTIDYLCGRAIQQPTFNIQGAKFVIPPIYDFGRDFSEGLAAVRLNNRWGFIDKTGKIVIPIEFNEGDAQFNTRFSDGLCAVRVGKDWGFIDHTGKIVIKPKFEADIYHPPIFSEGLAAVHVAGHNWLYGYIDTTGKMVIPEQFREAGTFWSTGFSLVSTDDPVKPITNVDDPKYSFWINRKGQMVDISDEQAMHSSANGSYFFRDDENKFGLKNSKGNVLIAPQYVGADMQFHDGLAAVFDGQKIGYINDKGVVVIPPEFESMDEAFIFFIPYFSEGFAPVFYPTSNEVSNIGFRKGKYGILDKKGHIAVNPKFFQLNSFSEGLAAASIGPFKCGYVDHSGDFVIPPQFANCGDFKNGMAKIEIVGKTGWIARN